MADVTELVIDLDSLTVGEVEEVEEATGLSLVSMINRISDETDERPTTFIIRALETVIRRRDDPSFTAEDAKSRRALAVRITWGGSDSEPTDPSLSPSEDAEASSM